MLRLESEMYWYANSEGHCLVCSAIVENEAKRWSKIIHVENDDSKY